MISIGVTNWYIEGLVNNIVGGTRYTGCQPQKKLLYADRLMYNLTQQINMHLHMKIMVFLKDSVSTPEYAKTMWEEAMFAEFEVLRIT